MSHHFSMRRERLTFLQWVNFMLEYKYYCDYFFNAYPHLKPDTSNHVMD